MSSLGTTEREYTESSKSGPVDPLSESERSSVAIGPSKIEGQGVINSSQKAAGDRIATAEDTNGVRTEAGRFINHSATPNAELRPSWDGLGTEFVALRPIAPDEEVTFNYVDANNTRVQARAESDRVRALEPLVDRMVGVHPAPREGASGRAA